MPTYALLGATGSTGSAILRHLLSNPPEDLTLNILVRSQSKLTTQFPNLESTTAIKVTVFEATPSDSTTLQACLQNTDVVFACIGTNWTTPGITLIQDTASAILAALSANRAAEGASHKTPTVIQLRSQSLNPTLRAYAPYVTREMASFAFHHIYLDLGKACEMFAAAADDEAGLLEYVFVDPPGIADPDGTTPTGHRLIFDEPGSPLVSYADLGVAFCEVAERRGEFARKAVGVTATGEVNATLGTLFGYLFVGLKSRLWG